MAEVVAIAERSLSAQQRAMLEGARARVVRLAASVARRCGTDNADDLAQLAMLKALEHVHEYDASRGATFDTFIFLTARRVMYEACLTERKDRVIADAAARGMRAVQESMDGGDPLTEDEGARHARLKDGRDALAAGVILGMFSAPETPEDLLILEQERARLADRVGRAMAKLDEEDRALVRACACEGHTVATAARALGLDYEKARYRHRMAMASLNRSLKAA